MNLKYYIAISTQNETNLWHCVFCLYTLSLLQGQQSQWPAHCHSCKGGGETDHYQMAATVKLQYISWTLCSILTGPGILYRHLLFYHVIEFFSVEKFSYKNLASEHEKQPVINPSLGCWLDPPLLWPLSYIIITTPLHGLCDETACNNLRTGLTPKLVPGASSGLGMRLSTATLWARAWLVRDERI